MKRTNALRNLQAVAGPFAAHVVARRAVQLAIDDGGEAVERALVAIRPGFEKVAHLSVFRRGRHGCVPSYIVPVRSGLPAWT